MEPKLSTDDAAQRAAKAVVCPPFMRWVEETVASIVDAHGLLTDCPKALHVSGN